MWKFKSIESISNEEKDLIIETVFKAILDNSYSEEIADDIMEYLERKGYFYFE